MDPWDNNNNTIHHQHRRRDHPHPHPHPSFSSTLLDQIYRSIDSSSDVSMRKKQNRADEKILVSRRKTAEDFVRSRNPEPVLFKHSSSSSSSDSSGFSSSESDSFYRRTRSSRSPPAMIHHPKPVRTTVERQLERPNSKVKSKALKMYSDLKKVKQPISPGGRLAAFVNSLFAGNAKKTSKTVSTTATSSSTTTCSSASSFSRSCLSKTTSSREKSKMSKTTSCSEQSKMSKTTSSSEKTKRSVRFCPVNVILDESSTCHRESRVIEENRRVIEAAKELIRTYQKSKDVVVNISVEDDDDDAASCASSDLFELDNLWAIGIDRYREELPVYETTRLNTNRIISR